MIPKKIYHRQQPYRPQAGKTLRHALISELRTNESFPEILKRALGRAANDA